MGRSSKGAYTQGLSASLLTNERIGARVRRNDRIQLDPLRISL